MGWYLLKGQEAEGTNKWASFTVEAGERRGCLRICIRTRAFHCFFQSLEFLARDYC